MATPRRWPTSRCRWSCPPRRSSPEWRDAVDAVYVCTWTSEHPALVAAAAERGLAVFCEKPLDTTMAGARRMHHVVTTAGVVHQVGLVLRSSPSFLELEHQLLDPRNGRVQAVVLRDDQFLPCRGCTGRPGGVMWPAWGPARCSSTRSTTWTRSSGWWDPSARSAPGRRPFTATRASRTRWWWRWSSTAAPRAASPAFGTSSGGPGPHPDLGTAVRAHEVVDAIYRSAANGGATVTISPRGG